MIRGGIVGLDEGFEFSVNNSNSQTDPDLYTRAYQAAWLHNSVKPLKFVSYSVIGFVLQRHRFFLPWTNI